MRAAADRACPEEFLWTENAWEMILREILSGLKPFIDIELDVLIEEILYKSDRVSRESMNSYITRRISKLRDLEKTLGQEIIKCTKCAHEITRQKTIPDEIWTYIIQKAAKLTEDQRKTLHNWGYTGKVNSQKLIDYLYSS